MNNSFSKAESFALILELIKTGKLELPRAEGLRDPHKQRLFAVFCVLSSFLFFYVDLSKEREAIVNHSNNSNRF